MARPFVDNPVRWQRGLIVMATFVTIILVFACLYWAKRVLIPLSLAFLLTFLLSPPVTALQRRGLRRGFAVLLVVALAGVLLAGVAASVVWQVTVLAQELPTYESNIRQKLADLREIDDSPAVEKVSESVDRITKEISKKKGEIGMPALPVRVENDKTNRIDRLGQALTPVIEPVVTGGLIVVLVIFLLMKRESMRDRLIRLIGARNITMATKALDDAGKRISRYLIAQLLLNSTFGLLVGLGLFLIGVPYAILWGVLAALLRYIPYLGAWLSAIFPIVLSIVAFEGWVEPILVILLFVILEPLVGMVLEPVLYGHSVGLSEAALLVALAFWTWIWGPVGLLLATPLTVCLAVLGEYVPYLEFFSVILGDNPVLDSDVRFYQRLLARDRHEATQIVTAQLEEKSTLELCDDIVAPALVYARRDLSARRLSSAEAKTVVQTAGQIIDELFERAREQRDLMAAHDRPAVSVKVLVCPVNDELDDVAVKTMAGLLEESKRCQVITLPSGILPSEVCEAVVREKPVIINLVTLPTRGLHRLRYLVKQLRSRFPELKIAVTGCGRPSRKLPEKLHKVGADSFESTFEDSLEYLIEQATRLCYASKKPESDPETPLAAATSSQG